MKKNTLLIMVVITTLLSCSKNGDTPGPDVQKFTIGGQDYTFKEAAYIDWGYDAEEHMAYEMSFILVPDKYSKGVDSFEQYPYLILIEIKSPTEKVQLGSFSSGDEEGDVAFLKGGDYYNLRDGQYSIVESEQDNFTITIDGILKTGNDLLNGGAGLPIHGTYSGKFYKELPENLN